MESPDRRFDGRAFVTLMVAFSGVGLPVTGVANHVLAFSPLSLERHAWMSAHNVLGLLFTVFSIWHLALNRRALWNHLVGAASRASTVSREAMAAVVVVGLSLLLFVGHAFCADGRLP